MVNVDNLTIPMKGLIMVLEEKVTKLEAELAEVTRQRDYIAAWVDDMAQSIPEVQDVLNKLAFFEEYGHLFFKEEQAS